MLLLRTLSFKFFFYKANDERFFEPKRDLFRLNGKNCQKKQRKSNFPNGNIYVIMTDILGRPSNRRYDSIPAFNDIAFP